MNTSFDDFTQMLGDDKRVQGLDAGNIKLTYNSVSVVLPCRNIYREYNGSITLTVAETET